MKPEDIGVDPYNNTPEKKDIDILEEIPSETSEDVAQIRAAIEAHRKGEDQRKAA